MFCPLLSSLFSSSLFSSPFSSLRFSPCSLPIPSLIAYSYYSSLSSSSSLFSPHSSSRLSSSLPLFSSPLCSLPIPYSFAYSYFSSLPSFHHLSPRLLFSSHHLFLNILIPPFISSFPLLLSFIPPHYSYPLSPRILFSSISFFPTHRHPLFLSPFPSFPYPFGTPRRKLRCTSGVKLARS